MAIALLTKRTNVLIALVAGLLVIAAGYVLVISRAAGPFGAVDASQATVAGGATLMADTTASAGKAIAFAAAVTPPPSGGGAGGTNQFKPISLGFAPYWPSYGEISMPTYKSTVGNKNFFIAFLIAKGGSSCTPAFDGTDDLNSSLANTIASQISQVRAAGGDVVMSFGGEGGTELAAVCSGTQLQSAYQSVVTKFGIKHLNFDLESQQNYNANPARAAAVAALQKADPTIAVSLTLPVETSGLPSDSLKMVTQMRDAGVRMGGIYIMSMYMGASGYAPVESSVSNTATQMMQIYSGLSVADAWKGLGTIIVIGAEGSNDTITTADAAQVASWAKSKSLGTTSFWQTDRDRACSGGGTGSETCSGTAQSAYQFGKTLNMAPLN